MIFFNRRQKKAAPSLPILHTERLVLRAFDQNDAASLYAFAQSETVAQMAGFTPHKTLEDSRKMVQDFMASGAVWAVVEKRTGRMIGFASLHTDNTRYTGHARKLAYTLARNTGGRALRPKPAANSSAMRLRSWTALCCPSVISRSTRKAGA